MRHILGEIRSAVGRLLQALPPRRPPAPPAAPAAPALSPLLARHLPPSRPLALIDVGACRGEFTRAVAAGREVAAGVLVEAIPHLASRLRESFPPPRYVVVECAAAAVNGTASFEVNPFEPTSSLLALKRDMAEMSNFDRGAGRRITCPTRKLDDIASELGLAHVDLLKLDVQGAELLVLSGAAELLRRTDLVWTEVSFRQLYESSCVFAEVYGALNDAGFRLMEVEPGYRSTQGELLQADALFERLA